MHNSQSLNFSIKESTAPISRVPSQSLRMVSVIYLRHESPRGSSVLPSVVYSGGQPSDDGLRELAAPSRHSPTITRRLVVSYTTFSPLPLPLRAVGGCFLLPAPTVTNCFHFQKWGTLCCPDFPPVPYGTSDRPGQCFRRQRYKESARLSNFPPKNYSKPASIFDLKSNNRPD